MLVTYIEAYDYNDLYIRLFKQYPHLIEINASNLTDRSLDELQATSASGLRVVELASYISEGISRRHMKAFISKCPKLVSLSLFGDVNWISDSTVQAIADHCSRLEKLTLSCGDGITNISVSFLLSLSHLRELDIMYCPGLTISGVQTLVSSVPNIESLCFDIGEKTDKDPDPIIIFQTLGSCCPRLRVLKCSSLAASVYDDGSVMPVFAGCPLLEEFEVQLGDEQSPNDQVLYALGSCCPRLKTVELGYREADFTDQGLIALSRGCPDLTDLSLHHAPNITDITILSFAGHCHKLKSICIAKNNLITSRAVCVLLKANPGVTSISLDEGLLLNEEVLLCLALHCRKLVYLKLAGCRNLTEAMLSTLFTRCTRLENLHLETAENVTDALIETIILHCKHLVQIHVSGCPNVTGLAVSHLVRLGKRLTWIHLTYCNLSMTDEFSRYYAMLESRYTNAANDKPYAYLSRTHWSTAWTAPMKSY